MKLKILELFGGIQATSKAAENLGIDHDSTNIEFDAKVLSVSNLLWGKTDKVSDVCDFKGVEGSYDLVVGGFPCFVGSTLVNTSKGLKPIKELKEGDLVFTHTNSLQKVTKFIENGTKSIWEVKTSINTKIETTKDHLFYVRERKKVWDGKKKMPVNTFELPTWKSVKELNNNFFVGTPINTLEKDLPFSDNDLYFLGKYLEQGFFDTEDERIALKSTYNLINVEKINYDYKRYGNEVFVNSKELLEFTNQIGKTEKEKHIPQFILDLPKEKLELFLVSYLEKFNFNRNELKSWEIKVPNEHFALTLGQAILKVWGVPFRFCYSKVYGMYLVAFSMKESKKGKHSFIEDGFQWSPIKKITQTHKKQEVYDITVEKDHSFLVQNIVVHNCQPFSLAGKQLGFEDPRGKMYLEALRIIKEINPKYVILENVKNIMSKANVWIIQEIEKELQEMGYKTDTKVVNAKSFIPQNRERVFVLGTKEDFVEVEIPLRDTVLMHYLENIYVSPSYNLTEGQLQNLKINFNKLEEEDINNIIKVGNCSKSNHRGLNIYSAKGILPTFTENHGASIKIIYEIPGVIPEGNYYSEEKLEKILNWNAQEKPLSKVAHPETDHTKTLTTRTQPGTASDQMVADNLDEWFKYKETNITLSYGSTRKAGYREKTGTWLLPIYKHYSKNVLGDEFGNLPTITTGSPKEIVEGGTIRIYENYVYLPNKKDYNGNFNRLWKDNKIIGTISTSAPIQIVENYLNLEKELLNNRNKIDGFENTFEQDNTFFGIGVNEISTLTSQGSNSHHRLLEKLFPFRLRSITPRESMRLMGWVDKDIDKIAHLSKGKIYKVAGNSMVVQVMEYNLKRLGLNQKWEYKKDPFNLGEQSEV